MNVFDCFWQFVIEKCKRTHYNMSWSGVVKWFLKKTWLNTSGIKEKDFLTLQELIERTGCSASTVRRDLSKLQQQGRLQRVHGGATLNSNRNNEQILSDKLSQNLKEKE